MAFARIFTTGTLLALGVALSGCPNPLPPNPMPTPGPTVIEGTGEPLIVDWQPQHRGDLEIAMKDGLAIVEYSPRGFRLLKNCSVEGTYGFNGISTKEQLVRLMSEDDVRANLPFGGAGLVAQMGGELGRSSTLDVAMIMIGKLRTTWTHVTPKDLKGGSSCAGATHFVKAAIVGAFVMDTGDKAHARAVAEFFKIGGSGGGRRESKIHNADGLMDDCKTATSESPKAPANCRALLRVELLEISGDEVPRSVDPAKERPVASCPQGYAMLEGKCTRDTVQATECVYGDLQQCSALCGRGSGPSCARGAVQLLRGDKIPKDVRGSVELAKKGCQIEDASSCEALGSAQAEARSMSEAVAAWTKACGMGRQDACTAIGAAFYTADGVGQDYSKAANFLGRGCKGGNQDACSTLGIMFLGNAGLVRDFPMALRLFKQACNGDSASGCSNYGYMVEQGKSVPRSAAEAARYYEKACKLNDGACTLLGALYQIGSGVPKNEGKAVELFRAACKAHDPLACATLRTYAFPDTPIDVNAMSRSINIWKGTCTSGIERDCTAGGVLYMAVGRKAEGASLLEKGCSMGDQWGCELRSLKTKN